MNRATGAAVLAAVTAATCWCGAAPSASAQPRTRSGAPPGKNVLVILLDTVRADRVGRPGLTPEIDRFARTAVRFERAYSHAPWTLPSVASLLTSRHPMGHGAGGRPPQDITPLPEEVVTLPERFAQEGSRTGAILNVPFLGKAFGMTQGYGHVDMGAGAGTKSERRAAATTDAALAYIDRGAAPVVPFFLFVHYFDAHLVYDPPSPFRERLADPDDRVARGRPFGTLPEMRSLRRRGARLEPGFVRRLEKLYDGEVAYLDQEVGRLLAGLARRGLEESTVVVLTADHGEEFLDHDGFEHGHTLYDELLHVPLLVRAPGVGRPGSVVPTVVRQIDVAPTLCALAGIDPARGFAGTSLAGLLRGRAEPDRPLLAQGALWGAEGEALRVDGMKLIRYAGSRRVELYDVRADPAERQDLSQRRPDARDRLLRELFLALEKGTVRRPAATAAILTEEQRERLRALGYVE